MEYKIRLLILFVVIYVSIVCPMTFRNERSKDMLSEIIYAFCHGFHGHSACPNKKNIFLSLMSISLLSPILFWMLSPVIIRKWLSWTVLTVTTKVNKFKSSFEFFKISATVTVKKTKNYKILCAKKRCCSHPIKLLFSKLKLSIFVSFSSAFLFDSDKQNHIQFSIWVFTLIIKLMTSKKRNKLIHSLNGNISIDQIIKVAKEIGMEQTTKFLVHYESMYQFLTNFDLITKQDKNLADYMLNISEHGDSRRKIFHEIYAYNLNKIPISTLQVEVHAPVRHFETYNQILVDHTNDFQLLKKENTNLNNQIISLENKLKETLSKLAATETMLKSYDERIKMLEFHHKSYPAKLKQGLENVEGVLQSENKALIKKQLADEKHDLLTKFEKKLIMQVEDLVEVAKTENLKAKNWNQKSEQYVKEFFSKSVDETIKAEVNKMMKQRQKPSQISLFSSAGIDTEGLEESIIANNPPKLIIDLYKCGFTTMDLNNGLRDKSKYKLITANKNSLFIKDLFGSYTGPYPEEFVCRTILNFETKESVKLDLYKRKYLADQSDSEIDSQLKSKKEAMDVVDKGLHLIEAVLSGSATKSATDKVTELNLLEASTTILNYQLTEKIRKDEEGKEKSVSTPVEKHESTEKNSKDIEIKEKSASTPVKTSVSNLPKDKLSVNPYKVPFVERPPDQIVHEYKSLLKNEKDEKRRQKKEIKEKKAAETYKLRMEKLNKEKDKIIEQQKFNEEMAKNERFIDGLRIVTEAKYKKHILDMTEEEYAKSQAQFDEAADEYLRNGGKLNTGGIFAQLVREREEKKQDKRRLEMEKEELEIKKLVEEEKANAKPFNLFDRKHELIKSGCLEKSLNGFETLDDYFDYAENGLLTKSPEMFNIINQIGAMGAYDMQEKETFLLYIINKIIFQGGNYLDMNNVRLLCGLETKKTLKLRADAAETIRKWNE